MSLKTHVLNGSCDYVTANTCMPLNVPFNEDQRIEISMAMTLNIHLVTVEFHLLYSLLIYTNNLHMSRPIVFFSEYIRNCI